MVVISVVSSNRIRSSFLLYFYMHTQDFIVKIVNHVKTSSWFNSFKKWVLEAQKP